MVAVLQLDVNSRVQHPVALFLHPVALFVSCYAPCPFCLVMPFINVSIPHIVDLKSVLYHHGPYLNTVLRETCHGQSNSLFKKRQKNVFMAHLQSNQFIRVIMETGEGKLLYVRVDTHFRHSEAKCPFCFGTVPFLLQHPALLKS